MVYELMPAPIRIILSETEDLALSALRVDQSVPQRTRERAHRVRMNAQGLERRCDMQTSSTATSIPLEPGCGAGNNSRLDSSHPPKKGDAWKRTRHRQRGKPDPEQSALKQADLDLLKLATTRMISLLLTSILLTDECD